MLRYIDKAGVGTHADPITSIIALFLFIIGFIFVLDLFRVKNRLGCYLCLTVFISSTLISNTLSYRFTSIGYGVAYLLATLSVYTIIRIKNHGLAICISGVLLGLSISCYQAYLAVFFVVAVFYAIFRCRDAKPMTAGTTSKSVACYLLRIFLSVLVAALFYVLSLSLCLKWYDMALSSYNGIGQVSLCNLIASLPQSILKAYQYFHAYFFMDKLKINRLESFGVFYILMAVLIGTIGCIVIKSWKAERKQILLLLPATAVIPVACNAYMLLASDKLELQMTAGLAMFVPLTMLLAFSCFEGHRLSQIVCTILCIALIYGNSVQVWIDQEAMYEGQNACDSMITQVINDLNDENLLSSDYEYFFVGVPEENTLFSVSDVYYCANAYAQMGRFWVSGNCCQASYKGLINRRLGLNLSVSYMMYENIADKIDISKIPEFPRKGYILLLDEHTVVVKIGEYKAYTGDSKYVID